MDTNILQTYVHIVEEGSFVAAARRMGISRSQASKYISDLEADLGTRLLMRSTRSVRMTELGERYYQRVRSILSDLKCANEDIRDAAARVAGKLRIGAPSVYVTTTLQPMLTRFMQQYPEIQLEMVLSEGRSDLHHEGLDAAIIGGRLPDSSLYARKLHSVSAVMVASPAYLEEVGPLTRPEDLTTLRCLHHSLISDTASWPLLHGQDVVWHRVNAVLLANNWDLLRVAALEGRGITVLPRALVAEDLAAGRLEEVLSDFPIEEVAVHLVYPDSRQATAALKAFITHLSQQTF